MIKTHRTVRGFALGATAALLLSATFAGDARAFDNAQDAPEWAAPEGFFVEPEALYMRFGNSNLGFATETEGSGNDSTTNDVRIDDDYELGFRFGVGYRWANRWSVGLRWTSIDRTESAVASDSGKDSVTNLFTDSSDGDWIEGYADQELDIIDFEVARTWGDLDGHHLKIFFGPRYLQYDESIMATTFDTGLGEDWVEDMGWRSLNADAFGIRVGLEGHVALGMETGWSFFGYAALSGLMADVDVHSRTAFDGNADGDLDDEADEFIDRLENFNETSFGVEAGLGFQWAHTFSSDWTFGVRFGWEVSNYTDIAGAERGGLQNGDDLSLDGAFVRLSFTW